MRGVPPAAPASFDPMAEVRGDVASGKLAPVYLLFGQESWLVRQAYDLLHAAAVAGGPRGFNEHVFEGGHASADAIAGTAAHLPMMGKYRTVVVRNVGKMGADDLERLGSYCANPSPHAVVLLLGGEGDKKGVDGRTKLARAIKKNGRWCEFKKLYGRNLHNWMEAEARHLGKRLDPDCSGYLEALLGNDLAQIANGLGLASLFVGESERISRDDLAEVVSGSKDEALWELLDGIGKRQLPAVLRGLQMLWRQGEEPEKVLALAKSRIRLLLKAERALAHGSSRNEALSEAGVLPNMVWKYDDQLGRYEARELQDAASRLLRAESDTKGGARIDKRWAVERAIVEVVGG